MDRIDAEINEVEKTITEAFEKNVRQLDDLQLALVGGGITDPVLH